MIEVMKIILISNHMSLFLVLQNLTKCIIVWCYNINCNEVINTIYINHCNPWLIIYYCIWFHICSIRYRMDCKIDSLGLVWKVEEMKDVSRIKICQKTFIQLALEWTLMWYKYRNLTMFFLFWDKVWNSAFWYFLLIREPFF